MTTENIKIRKAQKKDIPEIHSLVLELAKFENEPEAVKVDVDYYYKAFEDNVFQSIVALDADKIVGITIFYLTFSTWRGRMMYLEDFVVKKDFRNKGVGQMLWDAWIAESKAQGVEMVKWQVLDWNEHAIRFYERNGATIEKGWWNGKIIF